MGQENYRFAAGLRTKKGEFTVLKSLKYPPLWVLISMMSKGFPDLTQTLALSWLEDKAEAHHPDWK